MAGGRSRSWGGSRSRRQEQEADLRFEISNGTSKIDPPKNIGKT